MIGLIIHNIIKHTSNTGTTENGNGAGVTDVYDAYKAVYNEGIKIRMI